MILLALLAACSGNRASTADGAGAQLAFGVDMAKRGLWSEALFRFHQAERLDPGNPRILNNLAVAYEATGAFDKALDYYQKALRAEPGNREAKANYARFVEFYQSFKPRQPQGQASADSAAAPGQAAQPPPASPQPPETAEPPPAEPPPAEEAPAEAPPAEEPPAEAPPAEEPPAEASEPPPSVASLRR